ncbi:glycosyltransferase family 2 protein [Francisella sp. XLW-1]|uniref:glycosyltransferase family 2 protein n=1 Tax=Francisella sp. XLW-1 TaxID=2610887 RepID=UPI00123E3727|nr:glycosyltransferase family 2 protein [Francisella sp. XLW-1]
MLSLISIIVPVYNTEKYLYRCLDSIINQTYKNLEIIIVNDGSSDNSLEICQQYANRDDRVILIDKENGGLSSARNTGLDVCNGQYISFIDSDDWVSKNYIESLYLNLMESDAEISFLAYVKCVNSVCRYNGYDKETLRIYSREQIIIAYSKGIIPGFSCGWLADKEIFRDIRYKEGIVFEDIEAFYRILQRIDIAIVSNKVGYFYFQRNSGLSGSISEKFNIHQYNSFKYAYGRQTVELLKKYPNLSSLIYMSILKPLVGHYAYSYKNKNVMKEKLLLLYRSYYKKAKKNEVKVKLHYKIFFYFPNFMARIYLFMKKLRKTLNAKRITKE